MVVDSATNGLATLNTAPLPNGVAGWDGSLNPYPFDPAKAKDLLKSTGWTPGSDGILQKEGKSASFSLITYSGNSTWKRALEIMQSQLKDVGIEAKIQILEISAAVALFNKGEFDMALRTYFWPDPSFLYNVFRHNATVQRTEDPELENFFIKTDATLDPAKRLELVKQAQKMVLDRAIVAPIYSQWIIRAIQKKILGYKLDAIGIVLYNDISVA